MDQRPVWSVSCEILQQGADRDVARRAAADLARVAVDDAVAVSPGADEVVRAVRRVIEDGCRWRADAYGMLMYVLNHAYEWRSLRLMRDRYRGEFDASIAEEEAVFEALAGLDAVVREELVDDDPEVRAMACLLLGSISGQPELDAELVRMLFDAETDDLLRGCAAESLVRLGADGAEFLGDPAAAVRQRLAWFYTRWPQGPRVKFLDDALHERISILLREHAPLDWKILAEEV
ncbi:HEAT repeat domain-containing protein [Actinoplanes rectilineatus]|uniref:HEAT repeat domain-containing protein n=1 Tax=Actinoplanes rectilineatus TaxID=113571 RepID=UPI000A980FC0|nr:hypothetical protein [Actinoplanes rectilineatus]